MLSGRTVAVPGYGNQGSAQARDLRDSGAILDTPATCHAGELPVVIHPVTEPRPFIRSCSITARGR